LGVLGVSISDCKLLSVSDIYLALSFKGEYESAAINQQYRNGWEQTRVLASHVAAPHLKKKLKNLSDLFPLDWDEAKVKLSEADKQRMAAQRKRWDEEMQKKLDDA